MKYRIVLLILAVLISFSCNKDETVIGTDNSTGTTSASVVITSPNGGETLKVGESQTIKWTSNTTGKLKIEYSTNAGASWTTIADSVTNTQGYTWTGIPNTPSDSCLIKITDKSNTKNLDISDYYFKIIKYVPKSLVLTSPNGGENLIGGKSTTITWTELNVANVKLEYSINGGLTWNVFQSSYPADSLKYTWNPIPSVVASTCKIRITDASSDTLYDVSDNYFNIISIKNISIVAPTYNEQLYVGGNYEIKWIAVDIQYVKIEYSIDNGATYNTIASVTPNDSSFIWYNIPNTTSSTCRLRISDAISGTPAAVSPSSFIIAQKPSLNLTYPVGGDTLTAGGSAVITWTTTNANKVAQSANASGTLNQKKVKKISSGANAVVKTAASINTQSIKIEYSTDAGVTWSVITKSTSNSGSYTWYPVPSTISDKCRVRISDAVNGTPSDSSVANFSIVPAATKSLSLTSPVGGEVWSFGTTQNITWKATGISNVKIEYSIDGGTTYSTITSSYAASAGQYSWTIPNAQASTCKIRISDATNSVLNSSSPAIFTISPKQSVTVLRPHSGETLNAGSVFDIQWTSENIRKVRIQYSTNNGVDWTTITDSTASSGLYEWTPIPNVNSTNCRIKISDAADGVPAALNDTIFTIQTQSSIKVTNPNGGETIYTGSTTKITWTSSTQAAKIKFARSLKQTDAIENVKLELTTDGGGSWSTIISSTPNTGSYDWNSVPNVNSAQCKIKVSEATSGTPSDVSDSNFVISNQAIKLLTLTSPVGGESWVPASNHNITWTSSGIANVKIEYTIDGGATYLSIINSYAASAGSYAWTVPNITSSICKIRISDAANSSLTSSSNTAFTISLPQSITISRPGNGETINALGVFDIQWTSENIRKVKIEYSTNNGVDWSTITDSTESDGLYEWNPVPNIASTNCRIRISDASDGLPSVLNDKVFTILTQPTLKVLSPNGGETILTGTSSKITWSSNSQASRVKYSKNLKVTDAIQNVKIELTTDGGATWATVIASTANTGSYDWNSIPNINSTQCKVKISEASTGIPSDISDSNFVISNQITKAISVTSPVGGENWPSASSQSITWTSVGIDSVKIELTTDNGVHWTSIADKVKSSGIFNWSPVSSTVSTNCKIRITDIAGSIYGVSKNVFTISSEPAIVVTSPNTGATWISGTVQTISWVSTSLPKVKLEYTINNGATWTTIVDSVTSTGSYSWTIPNVSSTLCKVRVSDASDGSPADESDSCFTISAGIPKSLSVTSPVGGEIWTNASTQNITWTSSGVTNVKLEFTSNGGVSYSTIANSYAAASGSYAWTVPNISSSNCKVRISDVSNAALSSTSPATFTITPPQTISVARPHNGETINAGSIFDIQWTSENIKKVRIDYSTNNGVTWLTVTDSTESNGLYEWNPVPNISSTNCRIKVSDAVDSLPAALNDQVFTILTQPTIKVIAPNGGETIYTGSTATISWSSNSSSAKIKYAKNLKTTDAIQNVKIELTTDGGASWSTIIATTANTGSYDWNSVPNISSTQCKVRVSEATSGIPSDISDSNFVIYNQTKKSLAITSPVGSEFWAPASSQTISWTSVGISNVKLEYSTDGGTTFTTITTSYSAALGKYTWTLPNVTSTACKVRISDASNASLASVSPAVFTITPTQTVSVTRPHVGDTLIVGGAFNIQWTSENIRKVRIDYSTNNGVSWSKITDSTESNGLYTWSPIPNILSTNCRIKVSDAVDSIPAALNDQVFPIVTQPAIQVLVPNTNVTWVSGTTKTITWYSSRLAKVKLEYTENNGAAWTTIVDSVGNTGTYSWTVPNLNSTLCKIRVSDPNGGVPSDESDSCFTISNEVFKAITVTSPNGGENWQSSSSQSITWSSTAISKVKLEYTTNNGLAWSTIVDSTASSGLYQWNPVPQVSSTACKVRVSEVPASSVSDASDATFTINPVKSLQILYPNGGEIWTGGKADTIKWISSGVSKITIEYTYDGIPVNIAQNGWATIATAVDNSGSYVWSASTAASGYRIRVFDSDNASPVDESDGTFVVVPQPAYKITVLQPNGGEVLMSGQKDYIQWSSTNVSSVDIDFTTDGGSSWSSIDKNVTSTGSYLWAIPNGLASNLCRIKVKDSATGLLFDVSDTVFSIIQAKQLKVTFPNLSTDYVTKDTVITWYSSGVSTVNLELSLDNGVSWTTLASAIPSTGAFKLAVGSYVSSLARIRVTDATDATIYDLNDEPFNIGHSTVGDKTSALPPEKEKPPIIEQK